MTGFISCFQLYRYNRIHDLVHEIINFSPSVISSKKVVSLFFDEPSSRTRFSVESALYRLGADCITSLSMDQTSIAKGESFEDSARIWSRYSDIICTRHRLPGFANLLSKFSDVPVINLGDGFLEHPTQGLATVIHALKLFGKIRNLNICIWGDLAFSRCAHSVMIAFALLGASVWLFPVPNEIPNDLIGILQKLHPTAKIKVIHDLIEFQGKFHILYLNRLQIERRSEYQNISHYKIDQMDLKTLTNDGVLLHPLPRGEELSDDICQDSKVKIWEHVDMTYRTREWLLFQYLTEWSSNKSLKFNEVPFSKMGICNKLDCSSRLFRSLNISKEESSDSWTSLCQACLRII